MKHEMPRLRRARVGLAVMTAGLSTALIFLLCYALQWTRASERPNWHRPIDIVQDVISTIIIYGISGILATCLLGLPTWAAYRSLGWTSRVAYGSGGVLLGIATFLILALTLGDESFLVLGTRSFWVNPFVLCCALAGMTAALSFREVIRETR
jgi:hypothetical protein